MKGDLEGQFQTSLQAICTYELFDQKIQIYYIHFPSILADECYEYKEMKINEKLLKRPFYSMKVNLGTYTSKIRSKNTWIFLPNFHE